MNCRNSSTRASGRASWWKKATLFGAALALFGTASAQVTVPAANTNGSSDRHPYGSFFGFERTDAIYTAAEIGTTGSITTIAFFVNSVSSPATAPTVIRLKETTASTVTASTYASAITGATTVWSGNVTAAMLTANTWCTITLTTPFNYTGGANNLEVLIETNATGGGSDGSGTSKQFRWSPPVPAATRCQLWNQDNTAPTTSGSTNTSRPNLQINIAPATPCSGQPSAGSVTSPQSTCNGSTTTLTATGFTSGVSGISFQWEESPNGTNSWASVSGGTGATSSSYTTTTIATTRFFRMRVDCANAPGLPAYTNVVTVNAVNCTYDVAYTTGAAWTSIMPANGGSGTAFPGWQSTSSTAQGDDNVSTTVSLAGTTFTYQGQPVTGFQACSNGWMTFNTSNVNFDWSNDLTLAASTANNASSSQPINKILAPFWEDLVFTGQSFANRDACLRYQVFGTLGSGSAVIVVEWAGEERFNIAGPNLNFQVRLYEGSNNIEYVYGNFEGFDGTVTSAYTYSIGYNGATPTGTTAADRFGMQTTDRATNFWSATAPPTGCVGMPACFSKFTLTPGTYTGPVSAPAIPVPANDNVATPVALTVNPTPCTSYCGTYYTSLGATNSGLGTASCSTAGFEDDDVWFTFTANGVTNYTLTLKSSPAYNGVLQLGTYNGVAFTSITCANATGAGLVESITANALAAGTYYVRVFHNGAGVSTSSGQFSLCINGITPPPANDNICGGPSLTVNPSCVTTAGSTVTATASSTTPTPSCGTATADVWYKFTAATTGDMISVQSGSGFNAAFAVYSSADQTCTGTLTQLNCVNATSTGGLETYSGPWTVGNTYFVRVYHSAGGIGGSGSFTICVTATAPSCPSLTAPADLATVGTNPTTLSWSAASGATSYNVYFGTSPTPPLVGNQPGLTYSAGGLVVGTTYYWAVNGVNVIGTSTGCAVRSFTPQAPSCIALPTSPTNGGSACIGASVSLSWPAASGAAGYDVYLDAGAGPAVTLVSPNATQTTTTYNAGALGAGSYVWRVVPVNAFGSPVGCATWTFSLIGASAGDVIGTAIPIPSLPASVNGDNGVSGCYHDDYNTTSTPGSASNGRPGNDVFYTFTTGPCATTLAAGLCPGSGDSRLHLLTAAGVELTFNDDTEPVGCANSLGSSFTFAVTPSTQYYLVVDGHNIADVFSYTLTVSDGSVDTDGDGIADCVDNCPNLAGVQGGACNDNNVCTINDVITAGCVCAGTTQDTDGDGICDANDNCPNLAGVQGGACNDGDPCTINDVITNLCVCAGTPSGDTDGDGICNAQDNCPNLAGQQGDACNDGNVCTINDVISAGCVCVGTIQDTDGDGICDANDNCPSLAGQQGDACDDGNACTTNDVISAGCVCAGTGTDADNDGICDANDNCPNLFGQQGDACNDADPCTLNDVITNACVCAGTPSGDTDGDGICDATDNCPSLAGQQGDACNDGSACTINDVITAGCVCAGTFQDTDGDGICNANDNCPNLAGQQGDACNDGNACTINDVISAGCVCVGTIQDTDGDGVCDANDNCPNVAGQIGSSCNDGNVCTINDVLNGSCVCAGTFNDTDGDGICNANDNCPNLFGQQGDACNDGNPNTINDVITAGCVCVGTVPGCNGNALTLTLSTDAAAAQTSWDVVATGTTTPAICSGNGYSNNSTITLNCCVPNGCYDLRVFDSMGDGINPGGFVLRDANNNRILDNTNNGSTFTTVSKATTSWCVPMGTDALVAGSCDQLNLTINSVLQAQINPAVSAVYSTTNSTSGYQFWVFDPNGGFSRRLFQSHASPGAGYPPATPAAQRAAYLKLTAMSTGQIIPQFKLLNVRVRTQVNGVYNEFGPACTIKLDPNAGCALTQLTTVGMPQNPAVSCGATVTYPNGNIYANTVTGATKYQFRFTRPGYTRTIAVATRVLQLQVWASLPLQCGLTYSVDVHASFDGGTTYCPYGAVCQMTTSCGARPGRDLEDATTEEAGDFTIFPNPNRGGELTITLNGFDQTVDRAQVDINDLFGKRVMSETVTGVEDGMLNYVMPLSSDMASGVYVVNVTAGDVVRTQRLILQR